MGGLCCDSFDMLNSLSSSRRSNKYLGEFPIFVRCQKSQTIALWMRFVKNELDITIHNEVSSEAAFHDNQKPSKSS